MLELSQGRRRKCAFGVAAISLSILLLWMRSLIYVDAIMFCVGRTQVELFSKNGCVKMWTWPRREAIWGVHVGNPPVERLQIPLIAELRITGECVERSFSYSGMVFASSLVSICLLRGKCNKQSRLRDRGVSGNG